MSDAIGENKFTLVQKILQEIDLDNIHKLFVDNDWHWWNIGVPSKATIASEISKNLEYCYDQGVKYLKERVKTYRTIHKRCSIKEALQKVLDSEGYSIYRTSTGRFEYVYCIEREDSNYREILEIKFVPMDFEAWSSPINTIKLK